MAAEKPCSKLQSFFMTEGRSIIKSRMRGEAGAKAEAQIAQAAIDLKLPFILCWRAYQGRCGGRAFPKLYLADRALAAREREQDRAAEIAARLEGLERQVADLADMLATLAGEADRIGVEAADALGSRDRGTRLVAQSGRQEPATA
jgi:hypothetical protein